MATCGRRTNLLRKDMAAVLVSFSPICLFIPTRRAHYHPLFYALPQATFPLPHYLTWFDISGRRVLLRAT